MGEICSFVLITVALILGKENWVLGDENCLQEQVRLRAQVRQLETRVKQQQVAIAQLLHEKEVQFLDRGQENSFIDLGGKRHYADCSEIYNDGFKHSGFYKIKPLQSLAEFSVYCDMSDGGGWTVIQRRSDGSENFNRGWNDYENGFGNFVQNNGEYWLGNKNINLLTTQETLKNPDSESLIAVSSAPSSVVEILSPPLCLMPSSKDICSTGFDAIKKEGDYTLKIDLTDFERNSRFAQYENFKVGDEKSFYELNIGEYSGTAGDSLSGTFHPEVQWWASHQRMKFSTPDRDHDNYNGSCAEEEQSGWWFNRCHSANLNGVYYQGPYTSETDNGVVWYTWRGWWYSLKSVVMKIRPSDFIPNII